MMIDIIFVLLKFADKCELLLFVHSVICIGIWFPFLLFRRMEGRLLQRRQKLLQVQLFNCLKEEKAFFDLADILVYWSVLYCGCDRHISACVFKTGCDLAWTKLNVSCVTVWIFVFLVLLKAEWICMNVMLTRSRLPLINSCGSVV